MKNIIRKTLGVTAILLVTFVVVVGFGKLALEANSKGERSECLKWEKEAVEYGRKYFITSWQDDMCREYGIYVNAEVK